jgi:hypothetical protein
MQPNVLTPVVDVFLLRVSLIQNRRNGLAFEIVSLRWVSRCVKSNFWISQNFRTGVSYVLKELRT